jgi:hypothetical protein
LQYPQTGGLTIIPNDIGKLSGATFQMIGGGAANSAGTGRFYFGSSDHFTPNAVWEVLQLNQSLSSTRRLVIGNSGNVGIGPDITPDYKLDVQGTLNVDGVSTFGGNIIAANDIFCDSIRAVKLSIPLGRKIFTDAFPFQYFSPTLISSGAGLKVAIDANNNSTNVEFALYSNVDAENATSANEIFSISETGNVEAAGTVTATGYVGIQESNLPTRPISDITGFAHNVTTGTTDASGDIVVTHGLGATPTTVIITGGTNEDRTYQVLEASKTSTQFTVRVYDAGSTLVSSSATFNWIAIE